MLKNKNKLLAGFDRQFLNNHITAGQVDNHHILAHGDSTKYYITKFVYLYAQQWFLCPTSILATCSGVEFRERAFKGLNALPRVGQDAEQHKCSAAGTREVQR